MKQTLHTVRDCKSTNETKRNGVSVIIYLLLIFNLILIFKVSLDPDVRYEIFDGTELWFADVGCIYYIGQVPDDEVYFSYFLYDILLITFIFFLDRRYSTEERSEID